MFCARDKHGNIIDIDKAKRVETYYCPECGAELIQHRGSQLAHHFAHKSLAECIPPREPMTEWHLNWQREFPDECREVVFEKDGVKRRADVSIEAMILEFQHSFISDIDWTERTEFYIKNFGRQVFWIYDMVGRNIYEDLNYDVSKKPNTLYSGGKQLRLREFRRAAITSGKGRPVFLDYGDAVIMCWNFDDFKGAAETDKRLGYPAASVVLLTRQDFVQLIKIWSEYSVKDWNEVNISRYVSTHEKWFLRSLLEASKHLGWPETICSVMQNRFREYIIGQTTVPVDIPNIRVRCLIQYVAGRSQYHPILTSDIFPAGSFNSPEAAGRALEEWVPNRDESPYCYDVFQIDVVMLAQSVIYYSRCL